MRTRRLVTVGAPFSCIFLCLWLVRSLFVDRPHASSFGERLSVAHLKGNEEIVVVKVAGDAGPPQVRGYHVFKKGADTRIVAFIPARSQDPENLSSSSDKVLGIHEVSAAEALGLDAVVAEFRRRGEEQGFGIPEFKFQYLRNSKLIGEESFIGYSFAQDLAYLRRQKPYDRAELQEGYERLSRSYGIEYEQLISMVPFETFEERPNQSLEPMARSVTPRAGARVAPALTMAHH